MKTHSQGWVTQQKHPSTPDQIITQTQKISYLQCIVLIPNPHPKSSPQFNLSSPSVQPYSQQYRVQYSSFCSVRNQKKKKQPTVSFTVVCVWGEPVCVRDSQRNPFRVFQGTPTARFDDYPAVSSPLQRRSSVNVPARSTAPPARPSHRNARNTADFDSRYKDPLLISVSISTTD